MIYTTLIPGETACMTRADMFSLREVSPISVVSWFYVSVSSRSCMCLMAFLPPGDSVILFAKIVRATLLSLILLQARYRRWVASTSEG